MKLSDFSRKDRVGIARAGLLGDLLNRANLPSDQLIEEALNKLERENVSRNLRREAVNWIAILLDELPDGPQRDGFYDRYAALR